jgi:outer membrane protein OmpA-like peptidoglycan-associated protein
MIHRLLFGSCLLLAGCSAYIVRSIPVKDDTLARLDKAAQQLGCKTTQDVKAGDYSSDPKYRWVYNTLTATCSSSEVVFRQRLATPFDLGSAELYVSGCDEACRSLVDKLVVVADTRPPKVVAAPKPPPAPCNMSGPATTTVLATQGWQRAGISVAAGDVVAIETCGQVHTCQPEQRCGDPCYARWTGPAGVQGCPLGIGPVPDSPAMALVGRIGEGDGFAIGNQSNFPAPTSGELYLSTNDSNFDDNAGEFTVRLTVQKKPAAVAPKAQAVEWTGSFHGDRGIGAIVTSCEARGAEVCGNALDDDCDGRYDDKGCGITLGTLQWTLVWSGPADLDLHVVGPDGVDVHPGNPRGGSSGVLLDRDCRGSRGAEVCVENAYLLAPVPPPGTYRTWVVVKDLQGASRSDPVSVRLAGRVGQRVWHNDLSLAPTAGAIYRIAYAAGPDADSDGVADGEDACRDAAGRWSNDPKVRGCPDRDQDGVADRDDACPDKPGLTQAAPDKRGCPLVFGDAWVTNLGVTITSRIEFDTGKATLRPSAAKTLANVALALKARPGSVRRVAVEGHTDNAGTRKLNLELSQARAKAVADFLALHGIAATSLVPQGFADLRPVADNSTDAGKQANRRVEFVVIDPPPQSPDRW